MTQIFTDKGIAVPVTVISAGPITVTQVREMAKDGYKAVQFGFGTKRATRATKAEAGHSKDLGTFKVLREFRTDSDIAVKRGDKIDVSMFKEGDEVTVVGTSKGKGFRGGVKDTILPAVAEHTVKSTQNVKWVLFLGVAPEVAWQKACAWPDEWVAIESRSKI